MPYGMKLAPFINVKNMFLHQYVTDTDEEETSFLHGNVADPTLHTKHTNQAQRIYRFKVFFLLILVSVLTGELVFLAVRHLKRPSYHLSGENSTATATRPANTTSPWQDCGHNADMALSRECKFDIMTVNWEPLQCYYPSVVSQFTERRQWHFYNATRPTDVVLWEDVRLGAERFHVPWDFHFTHCNYAWRIMRAALISKTALPENLLSMGHTRHCMEVWTDRGWKMEDMHTLVHVKWPRCYEYGDWSKANYIEICGANGCTVKSTGSSE